MSDVVREFGLPVPGSSSLAAVAATMALTAQAPLVKFQMLAGATAAKATLTLSDGAALAVLRLDAKKYGSRGNQFKVTVLANASDPTKREVRLYEQTTLLRTWVSTISSGTVGFMDNIAGLINTDPENYFVQATKLADGDSSLATISSTPLATGNSGTASITVTEYTTALALLETVDFNELVFSNLEDQSIQTSVAAWVLSQREAGHMIAVTMGGALDETDTTASTRARAFNQEGVRYLWPGLVFNGIKYTGAASAPIIAGRIASKEVPDGLTFEQLGFVTDVAQRTTDAKIKSMLSSGIVVVVNPRGIPRIEKDINTLTNYPSNKNELYSSIRVIRELDGLYGGLRNATEDFYVGKVSNDEEGQSALLSAYRAYIDQLVIARWFRPGYTLRLSSVYASTRDRMFVEIVVSPIDSLKYVFATIQITD
jgi:hypothetical protein